MDDAWSATAWQALVTELDAWRADRRVATLWWRDDDAGQPHPGFDRLLTLAATTAAPLGLAVVPAWLTPEVAGALHATPAPVAVLQHGFAHANHETRIRARDGTVRQAECGPARSPETALAEVADGWGRLRAALGDRARPAFVPPWNRIAPAVSAGLPAVGHRVLSAFGPRDAAEPVPGLAQLNCHADPLAGRPVKRFIGAAATLGQLRSHLTDRREGHVDPREPTGLLTHHRQMSPACWGFLEELLGRLRGHPAVAFPPLASLLG